MTRPTDRRRLEYRAILDTARHSRRSHRRGWSAALQVTARDRTAPGAPDPVLSTIDRSDYDELWLFAVDTGDGLDPEDCAAISRFRQNGGGLLVTRDHMDLGSSVCTLGGVGNAHFFHSRNAEPDETRRVIDDRETDLSSGPTTIRARTAILRRSRSSIRRTPCSAIPKPPAA